MKFKPHDYQAYCIEYIKSHLVSALLLSMGLGKTVITLTAVRDLILDQQKVTKALVIAPLRVARDTWPAEIDKWDHLKDMTVSVIVGSQKERLAAIHHDAMVYVVNRENVKSLVQYYESNGIRWPYDMVIIDELSSFKNGESQRFRWLKRVRPYVQRWVGLTGTPASNSLMDLWAEMYILDSGERLGKNINYYQRLYFKPGYVNPRTGVVYSYLPKPGAEQKIYSRISDITISMKALDYLNLPECIYVNHEVNMSKNEKELYDKVREGLVSHLNKEKIDTGNAGGLITKLQQMANGAIYDDNQQVVPIHKQKLETLSDLIESANG